MQEKLVPLIAGACKRYYDGSRQARNPFKSRKNPNPNPHNPYSQNSVKKRAQKSHFYQNYPLRYNNSIYKSFRRILFYLYFYFGINLISIWLLLNFG